MDDLTILSEEALTALSKEDLDKLDKEKELIPALIRFNDNKQRLIVIKRSKYFEGSNYDLYNDSSNLMGIYSTNLWKNVPEQDMKLLYGTWLQHGKLSRNYKYEDFRKQMAAVVTKVKKWNYRYKYLPCMTYLLRPVDPTEEKCSFLDIVKDRTNFQEENSKLKAKVNDLSKDKLELELTNSLLCQTKSLLIQQIQELKERYEQTESNYKSTLEEFQNFKDNCRSKHMTDGKLIKELSSSKEKLNKANKRIAQSKSSQSRKRKHTEEINVPAPGTPLKHRKVFDESRNKKPFLYIKVTDKNILKGEYHAKNIKKAMTVIKVAANSYDDLQPRTQRLRVSRTSKALRALASGGDELVSNASFKSFFFKVLDSEEELVKEYLDESKYKFSKLSAEETLTVTRCLQWNGKKFKNTIRLFKSLGVPFLSSYDSVQALKKEKLKDFSLISSKGMFWKDTHKKETGIYHYSRVESLKNSVYKTLSEFKGQETQKLLLYKGKIIVVFTGDKGGSFDAKGLFMKWAFYVVTKDKPQDFSHFVVYAMMDAPDTADNMRLLHECYTKELEELQENVSPNGYKIHAVQSGDFMHHYSMLGLHGASSVCPSVYSTIPRDHVNYHKENPHIPHNVDNADCVFPDRTRDDLLENYIEISANNPRNPRVGGKHHESVIGPSLFPLKSGGLYQQVMLPIIHIVTGLFGKLIINFFVEIRELDNNSEQLEIETRNTKEEIKILENDYDKLVDKKIKTAEELIEVIDTTNHLKSEKVYTTFPRKLVCSAVQCKVDPKTTAMWIDCSHPNHLTSNTTEWMHAACEGMTDSKCEWYGEDDTREYSCNSCLKIPQESKLKPLLERQTELLEDLNKTGLDIERTKLAAEDKEKNLVDNIGKTEREVRQEMDRKNAKSEKYWGNTYNGPNTLRFLDSHREICSHIIDKHLREKWIEVYGTLDSISKSLIRVKPLDSEELEEFKRQIKKFSELWFKASGSVNIPTKFDTLVMHSVKIIENMGGITGAISEQSIERIHNVTNQEARVVYNISNKGQKLEYLMKVLEVNRSALNSDLAKGILPVKKTFTCTVCKAKISSKLQKCPTCKVEKRGLNRSLQKDFNAESNE